MLREIKILLQTFNRDLIIDLEGFGIFRNKKLRHRATRRLWYSFLSDEEFNSKTYKFIRCGIIADVFMNILKEKGYDSKKILLTSDHTRIKKKPYPTIAPHEFKVNSHAIIELNDRTIIDPMVGIIYNGDIDILLKRNISARFKYLKQKAYFKKKNYPHRDVHTNLFYTTKEYWNSVIEYQYYDIGDYNIKCIT